VRAKRRARWRHDSPENASATKRGGARPDIVKGPGAIPFISRSTKPNAMNKPGIETRNGHIAAVKITGESRDVLVRSLSRRRLITGVGGKNHAINLGQ